jgi:afadin
MSADDRREVIRLINEWNSSRYELFALSQPNERLEFHGVMRFYFQDAGEKVSTKCIRVDSTASTDDVIKVLIEKFRPDMKSLSSAKDYAIYEVHSDSQERKLGPTERPLWIQLDWGKDGREGRFLLKNENAKTVQFDSEPSLLREKKRLSKREKKKLQKVDFSLHFHLSLSLNFLYRNVKIKNDNLFLTFCSKCKKNVTKV